MTMRSLAATAVLASMAIHLVLWIQGMRDVPVIGPAFLLNVVAGLVIAYLLVRWHHWLPGVLSACFGMATLGAFTLATTIGLFGTHEHWAGAYVWSAAVAEVIAVLAGFAVFLEDPDAAPASRRQGGAHAMGAPQSVPERSSSGPGS